MRKLCHCIAVAASLLLPNAKAVGQDFTNDPQGAIDQSVTLASAAVEDPLIFAGLSSLVSRYNRARAEISPAGYENIEWLQGPIFTTISEVNAKRVELDGISPLPDEEVAEMLEAFSKNSDAFYTFYSDIQGLTGFQDVSPDQMLYYLSAYAVVANNVDRNLWDTLSSFTGVWPLCFWQG